MLKRILIITLIIGSLGVGLLQERLKININSNIELAQEIEGYSGMSVDEREQELQLLRADKVYDYYHSHEKMEVLFYFDASGLVKLKWIVTLALVVVHFCICYLLLRLSIRNVGLDLLYLYIACFAMAVVVYGIGKMIGLDFYLFSRRIVGFLQSILPAALLYLVSKIKNKV